MDHLPVYHGRALRIGIAVPVGTATVHLPMLRALQCEAVEQVSSRSQHRLGGLGQHHRLLAGLVAQLSGERKRVCV